MSADEINGPGVEPLPEERNWSVGAHIGALIGNVFVLGQIVVPLVIWLAKRDESPFIADQARESLNFQISMTLYFVISGALTYLLIGFLFIGILAVLEIVCVVIAAVHASRGQVYRYPFTVRLIS